MPNLEEGLAMAKERPSLNPLGMILCEGISRDVATGQLNLHRICDSFRADEFPCRFSFVAFVTFSEVRGQPGAHFRILDVNERLIGQSMLATVSTTGNPLQVGSFFAILTNIEFPESGDYFVQLWVNGKYIMEHRLLVLGNEDVE